MKALEEPTRHVMDAYRRRFNDPLNVSVRDLDVETRGRFVAALERALHRNVPLLDYEFEEFELSRSRRLWLYLGRRVARLAGRA